MPPPKQYRRQLTLLLTDDQFAWLMGLRESDNLSANEALRLLIDKQRQSSRPLPVARAS
jgi:hypothetical protein